MLLSGLAALTILNDSFMTNHGPGAFTLQLHILKNSTRIDTFNKHKCVFRDSLDVSERCCSDWSWLLCTSEWTH